MTAMTPIKEIWVLGSAVYALDTTDQLSYIACTLTDEEAQRLALILSAHHGREAYAFKPSKRRMVPLGESAPRSAPPPGRMAMSSPEPVRPTGYWRDRLNPIEFAAFAEELTDWLKVWRDNVGGTYHTAEYRLTSTAYRTLDEMLGRARDAFAQGTLPWEEES